MQTLGWYRRRLASMSKDELAWRAGSVLRDLADRYRIGRGVFEWKEADSAEIAAAAMAPGFRVSDVPLGSWATGVLSEPISSWRDRLLQDADAALRHRFSFFNLVDHDLGDPIDWHRDHESGMAAPRDLSMSIDYRDFRVTGDAKVVWEPNRHQHLVVLGRAYRVTGDPRFACEIAAQLGTWLEQNPFGFGMNWRSPLEQAVRLINWVWALDLIRESDAVSGPLRSQLIHAVRLHLWDIDRKLSRGSSANNHLIGEAAGVFIGSSYFVGLPDAGRRRERSWQILTREIGAQTYGDGCNRELAIGYHLFVLQFFLLSAHVARRSAWEIPRDYWDHLERMIEFVAALSEGGSTLPQFGDADDGYVLNLGGGSPADGGWIVAVGALLLNHPDLKRTNTEVAEPLLWLLGPDAPRRFADIPVGPARPLRSRAFSDSGLYLLQTGNAADDSGISVLFDCGELGFKSIAAHGHADALSVQVRAYGQDILVDPGTFDYFAHPRWREHFRGTAAHNTVMVDRLDQSTMLGPFLWGQRASARCLAWQSSAEGGFVSGEHDGYRRLSDPVTHRRTVRIDEKSRTIEIDDLLQASGEHEVVIRFHFSESCVLRKRAGHVVDFEIQSKGVRLEMDPALDVTVLEASEDPIGGWVSRGYHRRGRAATVVGSATCRGTRTFITRLILSAPGQRPALSRRTGVVESPGDSGPAG